MPISFTQISTVVSPYITYIYFSPTIHFPIRKQSVGGIRPYVGPSEPAFGTYELIICMKNVGKLIKVVRVIIGLYCKLINTAVPAK